MMTGMLALVGSGEYLPGMDPVDQLLLRRLSAPRVACVPAAAGTEGAAVIARWSRQGVEHFTRLGAQAEAVEIVDRASASDETLVARLRAANFVYLSGGKPNYLYATLKDTPALAALEAVLAAGGVVAGCSAGAMIWGEALPALRMNGPAHTALGRLPGAVILPHFDEVPYALAAGFRALLGTRTLLGIEGYTALLCADGVYTVAGRGSVTVWNRHGRQRYRDGQTLTW